MVKDYTVDSVLVLSEAVIEVRKEEKRYVVEAKVPLASLGIKPVAGTKLRGDFGVTFGDASGKRTRLRTLLEQPAHRNRRGCGLRVDA